MGFYFKDVHNDGKIEYNTHYKDDFSIYSDFHKSVLQGKLKEGDEVWISGFLNVIQRDYLKLGKNLRDYKPQKAIISKIKIEEAMFNNLGFKRFFVREVFYRLYDKKGKLLKREVDSSGNTWDYLEGVLIPFDNEKDAIRFYLKSRKTYIENMEKLKKHISSILKKETIIDSKFKKKLEEE